MDDPYRVHDVTINHAIVLGNGKTSQVTRLQFYIGNSGPFFHDFPPGEDSAEKIQQYIRQKQNDLRTVLSVQS